MARNDLPHCLKAPFSKQEQMAFRALLEGNASADQQKLALNWMINIGARTYDVPFQLDDESNRQTVFMCGRAFVGKRIVTMLNGPVVDEKGKPNDNDGR